MVSIITNMVSRSPELMSELRRLLDVLEMLDCELSVHYIKSAENKVADYFSLLLLISSWHSFVCLRGSADKCSPKQVGWVSPADYMLKGTLSHTTCTMGGLGR